MKRAIIVILLLTGSVIAAEDDQSVAGHARRWCYVTVQATYRAQDRDYLPTLVDICVAGFRTAFIRGWEAGWTEGHANGTAAACRRGGN